jgi:hypothetical protein
MVFLQLVGEVQERGIPLGKKTRPLKRARLAGTVGHG